MIQKYKTIIADPPWRFSNSTGKVAPEHKRLYHYPTMSLDEICSIGPWIQDHIKSGAHLYLWAPTALLNQGLLTMAAWGFDHKTNIYWHKITKDGISDRSCMGFYYRNVVKPCLFGVTDRERTNHFNIPNLIAEKKRSHSQKPEAFYSLVQRQSDGPYLELFARQNRPGIDAIGNDLGIQKSVLITTDLAAIQTWKEVVEDSLRLTGGRAHVQDLYKQSLGTFKVRRGAAQGHQWKAQIRRTLQKHFFPEGKGLWSLTRLTA